MATKTVSNLAIKSIAQRNVAGKHLMEEAADARAAENTGRPEVQDESSWEQLLDEQRSSTMDNIYVYPEDFIYVIRESPRKGYKMLRHILLHIYKLL